MTILGVRFFFLPIIFILCWFRAWLFLLLLLLLFLIMLLCLLLDRSILFREILFPPRFSCALSAGLLFPPSRFAIWFRSCFVWSIFRRLLVLLNSSTMGAGAGAVLGVSSLANTVGESVTGDPRSFSPLANTVGEYVTSRGATLGDAVLATLILEFIPCRRRTRGRRFLRPSAATEEDITAMQSATKMRENIRDDVILVLLRCCNSFLYY